MTSTGNKGAEPKVVALPLVIKGSLNFRGFPTLVPHTNFEIHNRNLQVKKSSTFSRLGSYTSTFLILWKEVSGKRQNLIPCCHSPPSSDGYLGEQKNTGL